MTDFPRVLEAVHQQHRIDTGKMTLQLSVYRQQLIDAGIEPADRDDEELMQLWKAAADTVSAAAAFVGLLGSGKELLDPNLVIRP